MNITSSARQVRLFTKSDTAKLPIPSRGLLIATAGDLRVTDMSGEVVTIPAVPAGIFPIECTKVWSTGTTAVCTVVLGG